MGLQKGEQRWAEKKRRCALDPHVLLLVLLSQSYCEEEDDMSDGGHREVTRHSCSPLVLSSSPFLDQVPASMELFGQEGF